MENDLKLELLRDGNVIQFRAKGRVTAAAGDVLDPRQPPALDPNLVEEMRRGAPNLVSVETLADNVSDWLLRNDFKFLLRAALQDPNNPVRLIFSIDQPLRSDVKLGSALSDLPFELLRLPGDTPLVLSPKITAFVHLLDKVSNVASSLTQHNPPLRILIVRSNPSDLGGTVPDSTPVCNQIMALGAALGNNMVQVDVLSRGNGAGVTGLPTLGGLLQKLQSPVPYDILVFLGHGDLNYTHADELPLSLLYLENDDGSAAVRVDSSTLAILLQNNPVPVVLLMGCYTAAQLPAQSKDAILNVAARSMRGSQGVAQALVNSASGVQLALGMRCRLDGNDAQDFLQAFFSSLLKKNPGHVEAAIHAGRLQLRANNSYPGNWAAPILFRTLRDEPMFEFLQAPPTVQIEQGFQLSRAAIWEALKNLSYSKDPGGAITALQNGLARIEAHMVSTTSALAPLLLPGWQLAHPGETIQVLISLHGALTASTVTGKLLVDGDVTLNRVTTTQQLRTAGWRLLPDVQDKRVEFNCVRDQPGPGPLPQDALMIVELKLGAASGAAVALNLIGIKTDPQRAVCPGNSVVIVPLP